MNDDSLSCLVLTIFGLIGAVIGYAWGENLPTALVLGFIGLLLGVPASAFIKPGGSSQRVKGEEVRQEDLSQQSREGAERKREEDRRRGGSRQLPQAPSPRIVRDFSESEQLAAEWIRHMGWSSARVTQPGQDSGLDVIGRSTSLGTVVAQVKMEAQKTGRPVLQNLNGAGRSRSINAEHLMFFSSAGYARSASEWANGEDIALFRFTLNGSIQAENEAARRYLAHEHVPERREYTDG